MHLRPAEFFTALIDTNGNEVVQYWYDAWGNHKVVDANGNKITSSTHIGNLNPFRYRGYYYDVETGLYFLQTRYYDPVVGRFLNRDSVNYADPSSIHGLNLYAYCLNNPVEYVDPTGHGWWDWLLGAGMIIGTVLFMGAIVASAGAVGALAGLGAASIGLSAGTVSTITTLATFGTYVVAGGVGIFGLSDAVEIISGGYNPIRDDFMGGNQSIYNTFNGIFYGAGSLAVFAGAFAPKILKSVATKWGAPKFAGGKIVGYEKTFMSLNGTWSFRIDATTHGSPKYHHNPHIHLLRPDVSQGGITYSVFNFWNLVEYFFFNFL